MAFHLGTTRGVPRLARLAMQMPPLLCEKAWTVWNCTYCPPCWLEVASTQTDFHSQTAVWPVDLLLWTGGRRLARHRLTTRPEVLLEPCTGVGCVVCRARAATAAAILHRPLYNRSLPLLGTRSLSDCFRTWPLASVDVDRGGEGRGALGTGGRGPRAELRPADGPGLCLRNAHGRRQHDRR